MQTALSNGADLCIPGATTNQTEQTAVQGALSELQRRPMAAAASAQNPSGFPQTGNAINNKKSWQQQYSHEVASCNVADECILNDRLTAKLILDPNSQSSRMSAQNMTYFPNEGHFTEAHFENWALCYASETQCGHNNSQPLNWGNGSKRNVWYLASRPGMFGHDLTHAFIFWADYKNNNTNRYYSDKQKTGTAKCPATPTNTNNVCKYP
jgi:hypothetical protein